MNATDLVLETLRKVAVAIDGKKARINGKNVRLVERHDGVCVYGLLGLYVDQKQLDPSLSETGLWRAAAAAIQELKKQDLVFPNGYNNHSRDAKACGLSWSDTHPILIARPAFFVDNTDIRFTSKAPNRKVGALRCPKKHPAKRGVSLYSPRDCLTLQILQRELLQLPLLLADSCEVSRHYE